MRIDICIPAFNEEKIIAEAAAEVSRVLSAIPNAEYRILVANNGSTDHTADCAQTVAGVSVLAVPTKGKGAAVVYAANTSTADIFGFIDADLSAAPAEIATLLAPILGGTYDIAIGSRLINTRAVTRAWPRTFSSRLFNVLRKIALGISVEDAQCGLKLMNARGRSVLATCTETGWFFDIEFLVRAQKSQLRIIEVPIQWDEHRFAGRKSKLNILQDGFGALGAFWRIRALGL